METSALYEEDHDLVARALRGDEDAFRRLVERHHDKVFHLVRGILGDWHWSEDVCQDVFTIIYRKLSGFRHDALFSTWMYRIAANAALKARRRRRGMVGTETLEAAGRIPAPKRIGEPSFEGDEVIDKLLKPLPEKLRVPVILREAGGLSYDEIASVIGCTRGAVEQRLHRAMVLLRSIWKDKDGGPAS